MSRDGSWWRVRFPQPEEGTLGALLGVLIFLVLLPFLLAWEWLSDWWSTPRAGH